MKTVAVGRGTNRLETVMVNGMTRLALFPYLLVCCALFSFSIHAWSWMWYTVPALLFLSCFRKTTTVYATLVIGMMGGTFWSFCAAIIREMGKPHSSIGLVTIGIVSVAICVGFLFLTIRVLLLGSVHEVAETPSGQETSNGMGNETSDDIKPEPLKEEANPYQVLGVAKGASSAEIRSAYLKEIQLYHPDRVAHLGADLQKLAHERATQIRRAYETLHSA